MHQLIASPHKTRRPRSPRNEQCGDCGGSGANSSGTTCGACNGLGEIHCRSSRVPSRSMTRKEGR